jgi:hypothetical protein
MSFVARPHKDAEVEMQSGGGDTKVVRGNQGSRPLEVNEEVGPSLRDEAIEGNDGHPVEE